MIRYLEKTMKKEKYPRYFRKTDNNEMRYLKYPIMYVLFKKYDLSYHMFHKPLGDISYMQTMRLLEKLIKSYIKSGDLEEILEEEVALIL